ncbi:glycosyltransferase family 9 protein [Pontibacter sp. BT310]|uniref:Glycosyltransferase family 9 protein n=1 Tax=Pontibacter populi TaxID=890055 RepID=A0ABS6X7D7_9BACT|nr:MULTISPECIES: glycosyltransferase family 9 protein [Pontibacter]MBJ6117057.1 glycosyltransferase family 9 protein [Pontibacter sp. BT310]MBR0569481.1 glycosyltransferase family 9 protein [Microvirga sp. STS03]MBW3363910.1 glycosyltransferase family 9 protein [Pontibacter populi]
MQKEKLKILIIRFSSIGDIIYTTPVVRCLKLQVPGAEIHFLTKPGFRFILDNNPYVDKLHLLKDKLNDTIQELKAEQFDYVIDLHNSLRSVLVKYKLGVKFSTFKKQRIRKILALKFKLNTVKPTHLVDRYLETVKFLGVVNDQKPVDYFLPGDYSLNTLLPETHQQDYVAFIIGATHFTKRMPNEQVISICNSLNKPVVLLGGKDVEENGTIIAKAAGAKVYNACGKLNMNESVYVVKQAAKVIGFDTGLTHISEAFDKELVTIWGSTVPELLGVQPYQVTKHYEAGVELPCRPCTKFGRSECPLGHFKCMRDIDEQAIVDFANREL